MRQFSICGSKYSKTTVKSVVDYDINHAFNFRKSRRPCLNSIKNWKSDFCNKTVIPETQTGICIAKYPGQYLRIQSNSKIVEKKWTPLTYDNMQIMRICYKKVLNLLSWV